MNFTSGNRDAANRFGIHGYGPSSYGDAFADVYDEWYAHLDDDDFISYVAALLPERSAKVLELGVGTGRLLEKLRRHRHHDDDLYGIDSSVAMLDKMRERPGLSHVTAVRGDFSECLPDHTFDLIFVGYNTLFNLPDDTALLGTLRLVRAHLAPTGYFVLDVVEPEPTQSPDVVAIKSITAETVTLSVSRHDHDDQRITGQFIDISTERGVTLRPWSVRYWTPTQLDNHARSVGLALHRRTADGMGTIHHDDDARHISTYQCS